MTEQAHISTLDNGDSRYATCEDFRTIFHEDLPGLYQLSFLLTGDHQKGERCFVAGIEDCAKANKVFRQWARSWAKRVIVESAIREVKPRRGRPDSVSLQPTRFSQLRRNDAPIGYFAVDTVIALADFERFVFVLCVLERYRERECSVLLGCSSSEVREARTRAIEQLSRLLPVPRSRYQDRLRSRRVRVFKA